TVGQFMPIAIGAQIYYAPGLDKLIYYISVSRPTLVLCVPRLYDAMKQKITQQLTLGSPLVRRIFERTVELGKKRYYKQQTLRDCVENKLLDLSVRRSFKKRFGGQLKAFVSGGAPLNIESGLFFNALGAVIFQGYGQTESSPLITVTEGIKDVRLHTVGPATPDIEVKIGDGGEILTRSESIMKGYWNKPELNPVDEDGWLHTGDVGYLDDKNNLVITDRIKDLIVNSGGDNISPVKVEAIMAAEPEVGQIMVYGDRQPHLVAVVVPNDTFIAAWNKKHGTEVTAKTLAGEEMFQKAIMEGIHRANAKLSLIEQVKKIILADEPFSIDNGMVTPSMKVKRPQVRAVYGERLEALYKNRI
ncbi:MAG: AMP-binding protein, partial [Alphaproteobacteria bacterium]|nr:AMP-binding protein [Alphaproteobacteria bacterium]